MKILIDMNLSPAWVDILRSVGHDAVHWSTIGDPGAPDDVLMDWARNQHHVVLTHDLDFGTLLALTRSRGPSVLQVRTQNIFPEVLGPTIIAALKECAVCLEDGALVVVELDSLRIRMLPINR